MQGDDVSIRKELLIHVVIAVSRQQDWSSVEGGGKKKNKNAAKRRELAGVRERDACRNVFAAARAVKKYIFAVHSQCEFKVKGGRLFTCDAGPRISEWLHTYVDANVVCE